MLLILCWFRHIKTSQTVVFTRFFTWVQGRDLNPRPPGYHFVPVAVVCREYSPVRLCSLALWATPLSKTIHRIVFDSLTQRATLIGLITRYIKRRTDMVRRNVGAGEGFEPPTSGL